jgi:hypothetical protein
MDAYHAPQVGEFWWKVHMEAVEGGLLELPPLSAAFGRSADLTIPISNPLDVPAVFNLRMKPPGTTGSAPSSANSSSSARRTSNLGPGSNSGSSTSGCFSVSPAQLKLEPYENGECVLTYRPSQLGKMEAGRLVVHSDTAGSLLYDVEGQVGADEGRGCGLDQGRQVQCKAAVRWAQCHAVAAACCQCLNCTPADVETTVMSCKAPGGGGQTCFDAVLGPPWPLETDYVCHPPAPAPLNLLDTGRAAQRARACQGQRRTQHPCS